MRFLPLNTLPLDNTSSISALVKKSSVALSIIIALIAPTTVFAFDDDDKEKERNQLTTNEYKLLVIAIN